VEANDTPHSLSVNVLISPIVAKRLLQKMLFGGLGKSLQSFGENLFLWANVCIIFVA
jgi:hypothetical protein